MTEILGAPQRETVKEKQRQIRLPPRLSPQGRYAGTRLFDRRGMAQGRRGLRPPPDRFARPPYPRKGGPSGPPFRPRIFSFDRPRPFVSGIRAAASGGWPPTRACGRSLFDASKRKWGRVPPGNSRPPGGGPSAVGDLSPPSPAGCPPDPPAAPPPPPPVWPSW